MTLTEQLKQVKDTVMMRMPESIIQTFKEAIEEINTNRLKEKALQIGDTITGFSLININGNTVKLEDVFNSEYLVLNFYRGGWCPYCNMELREYERLKDDFKNAGADIIGISAEVPTLASQTKDKNTLSFPVLTDKDAEFMKAIGIVFQLNEKAKKDYVGFGMDFTQIHGNENYELPVPAVYIIDKNRKVIFVHFEADYMTRIEPKEVLNFIKNNKSNL
ncbi:peroxiredoxin [Maribacter vaceletii]|uniref:thioredoxin-dependent peroxiredoxin n=1 Tax=Maribacter vaceletii TaxID=1206816 RepID=A0A495DTK4_9FLAO|nr:peroxiredoxin family protein [Maribacter vaceletii]RKR07981.1 peroxiredoxin [Maribacter vaceletii]